MSLLEPWPWYVAGPLIGLVVPLLLIVGGRLFGVSATLRDACAALPVADQHTPAFLRYDWRASGRWNFALVAGIGLGGFLGLQVLGSAEATLALAPDTQASLRALGLTDLSGFVPRELVAWSALTTGPGLIVVLGGGFLIGFGARWAGGCTSGHAISGLADLQVPSLVAVLGFFIGGLFMTYIVLPVLL
ncbi:MAG: YeeE/YedE thiosulfate transporter family protein [Bacteroidota bacterium]